jgi:flagellar motor switch protein FliM
MTAPNEILSQSEVDALLNGASDDPAAAEAPAEDVHGVKLCDLTNPPRTIRGRMPTLDIIHDRFARAMRGEINTLLRRNPEIDPQPPRVEKYGEFLGNLVTPTNLNVINLKTLSGMGLIVLEPALVFCAVDHLFGGDGRYHMRIEGRDFTPVEQRIIKRLLDIVTTEYERAWEAVHPMQFEYVRSEMHSQFVNILQANDLVVASTFNMEIGNVKGAIHICLPYAALEPLRDALANPRPAGDSGPGDRWIRLLTSNVQQAEVQLSAPLAHLRTPLAQLMKLKAGDVLPVEVPQKIRAEIEGVPILECRFGIANGRYALMVERIMSSDDNELTVSA